MKGFSSRASANRHVQRDRNRPDAIQALQAARLRDQGFTVWRDPARSPHAEQGDLATCPIGPPQSLRSGGVANECDRFERRVRQWQFNPSCCSNGGRNPEQGARHGSAARGPTRTSDRSTSFSGSADRRASGRSTGDPASAESHSWLRRAPARPRDLAPLRAGRLSSKC